MQDQSPALPPELAMLLRRPEVPVGTSPPAARAAGSVPATNAGELAKGATKGFDDSRLEELINRVRSQVASGTGAATAAAKGTNARSAKSEFLPLEPASFKEAQLSDSFIESLILKFLLARGDATGREVADQIKLPFKLLDELLRQMKTDQTIVYRGAAAAGDYQYQLTDMGRERARRMSDHCTYFGSAPVAIKDYIASVAAQSLMHQHPTPDDLDRAFGDLLLNKSMLRRLGPAINSGRGLFLYGSPGNGKSSIAERVMRAFDEFIWIPRALVVDGEIMRLFDPSNHEVAPVQRTAGLLDNQNIDMRWIRVRRPTVVVGGELTMSALEVTLNTSTGISEAPLQLKSNCGSLVIDDFGRQRMSIVELLNRWIVPLEKRIDFLNMPNGKKIEVPFDQLIIFSTNLEPRDLVDDAFLRRIPYKIDVADPNEEDFRHLFRMMAAKLGFDHNESAVDYLIERHYRPKKRPFRCCQPRDLLMQIHSYCKYMKLTPELTPEYFDIAVETYFGIM